MPALPRSQCDTDAHIEMGGTADRRPRACKAYTAGDLTEGAVSQTERAGQVMSRGGRIEGVTRRVRWRMNHTLQRHSATE